MTKQPILANALPDCTCYRLRQAARLLSRSYDGFLISCGISIGQFGLLATIAGMEAASISTIADTMKMDRTTLTRNLTPLQRIGYVVTEPGSDGRSRSLRLTASGKKAFTAAMSKWRAAQIDFEKQLGTSRVKQLNADLDGLLKKLPN